MVANWTAEGQAGFRPEPLLLVLGPPYKSNVDTEVERDLWHVESLSLDFDSLENS